MPAPTRPGSRAPAAGRAVPAAVDRVPGPVTVGQGPVRPGRRAPALVQAGVASVGVLVVWWLFVATRTGQLVDQAALEGSEYGSSALWRVAEPVLDVISLPFVGLVLLATMLLAVLRRRFLLAVQVLVLMGGANLTTQVLKHTVLVRPDLDVGDPLANALPSGHTTAAASVSAALLLVVPRRVRPVAAVVGGVYTAATGISTLVGQWHRPSDVVAGVLVVAAWAGVAAALGTAGRPVPADHPGPTAVVVSALGLGGAAAALGAVLALERNLAHLEQGQDLASRADLLTAYGGGALAVLATIALTTASTLLVVSAAEPRLASGRVHRGDRAAGGPGGAGSGAS